MKQQHTSVEFQLITVGAFLVFLCVMIPSQYDQYQILTAFPTKPDEHLNQNCARFANPNSGLVRSIAVSDLTPYHGGPMISVKGLDEMEAAFSCHTTNLEPL